MSGTRTLRVTILGDASGAARALAETGASAGHLEGVIGGLGASFSRAGDVMRGALVGIGFAAAEAGIEGLRRALGGLKAAFIDGNSANEQIRASLFAFFKDSGKVEEALAALRKEAALTPFSLQEMAQAFSSLLPVSKQSGVAINDLVKQAEILAASNPLQGMEGASFSLREAMTGDFTSIIERFNLSRASINRWKEEGVPNIEIVRRAMLEMGFDADLIAAKANTLDGRWSTLMDTFASIQVGVTERSFQRLSEGLGRFQTRLDANMPAIQRVADALGELLGRATGRGIDLLLAGFDRVPRVMADLARRARALRDAFNFGADPGDLTGSPFDRLLAAASKLGTIVPGVVGWFKIINGAVQDTFRALRGGEDDFRNLGADLHFIDARLAPLARGVQLAKDSVLTFRQSLSGDWFKSGAGNQFVNTVGAIGLSLGNLVRAVRPFVPQLLILGRGLSVVLSPLLSFGKAMLQTGGDVRSALNLMRRQIGDGLLALGSLVRALAPKLGRALWGFLEDAATDFGRAWQQNRVNDRIRDFIGKELPKLAAGAAGLASKLWTGLGDIVGGFASFWQRHNITQGIKDRLVRFLGGLTGLGDAIWTGLGDLGGAFKDWFTRNDVGGKIKATLSRLWPDHIQPGIQDAWNNLTRWIQDNGPGILTQLGKWGEQFGTWAHGIWTNNLAPEFVALWNGLVKWFQDNGPGIAAEFGKWIDALNGWAVGTALPVAEKELGILVDKMDVWVATKGYPQLKITAGKLWAAFVEALKEKPAGTPGEMPIEDVVGNMIPQKGSYGIFADALNDANDGLTKWAAGPGHQALVAVAKDLGTAFKAAINFAFVDDTTGDKGTGGKPIGAVAQWLNSTSDALAKWLDEHAGPFFTSLKNMFIGFNDWLGEHSKEWIDSWYSLGDKLSGALLAGLLPKLPKPIRDLIGLGDLPTGSGAGFGGQPSDYAGPGPNPGQYVGTDGKLHDYAPGASGGYQIPTNQGGRANQTTGGTGVNLQALGLNFGGGGGGNTYNLYLTMAPIEFRESPEEVGMRLGGAMIGEMRRLTQQNGGGGGGLTGGPIG